MTLGNENMVASKSLEPLVIEAVIGIVVFVL